MNQSLREGYYLTFPLPFTSMLLFYYYHCAPACTTYRIYVGWKYWWKYWFVFHIKMGICNFWSYIDPGDSSYYLFCLFCSSPCLLPAPLTMESSCCCFSPPAGYLPALHKSMLLGKSCWQQHSLLPSGAFSFHPPGSGMSRETARRKYKGSSFVLPVGICSIPRSPPLG